MNELMNLVREFNTKRSWNKFLDPRSIILALCGELGELAHHFRWRTRSGRKLSVSKRAEVENEIADIFIFMFALCVELDVDPEAVVMAKLRKNEKRFPLKTKKND
jgi:NTP pyrophosphatase (non-canonical NTP hydrolase)